MLTCYCFEFFEFPVFSFKFYWDLGVGTVSSFLMAVLCIAYFPHPFLVFDALLIFVVVVFFLWSMINTTGMPNGLYIH